MVSITAAHGLLLNITSIGILELTLIELLDWEKVFKVPLEYEEMNVTVLLL